MSKNPFLILLVIQRASILLLIDWFILADASILGSLMKYISAATTAGAVVGDERALSRGAASRTRDPSELTKMVLRSRQSSFESYSLN